MFRWMTALGVAALVAGACVPAEGDDDIIPRFSEETVMYVIQERGTLRVGVPEDAPPFAFDDAGEAAGFSVEFARLIAESMGVEPQFTFASSDAQLLGLLTNGEVDIAFPLIPITEEGVRLHRFTDPLWVGHQRLLVGSSGDLVSVDDLTGQTVCSSIDSTTGVSLDIVDPEIDVHPEADPEDCIELLDDGSVTAITAPDTTLLQLVFENPELSIVGEQITTAGYGGVLGPGTSGFVNFINSVITEGDEEGDWTAYYEEWIAPLLPEAGEGAPGGESPVPDPPDMTWEEAAALFPSVTE